MAMFVHSCSQIRRMTHVILAIVQFQNIGVIHNKSIALLRLWLRGAHSAMKLEIYQQKKKCGLPREALLLQSGVWRRWELDPRLETFFR